MSRGTQQPASSRYQISSPQPISQNNDRQFGEQPGPYPSFAPAQSSYTSQTNGFSSGSMRHNDQLERSGTPTGSGPLRPARSIRRTPSDTGGPTIPSRRHNLAPLQTQTIRRPSNGSAELPLSPISPISPAGGPPQANALFSDPWAADRSHRTELRTQASEAAQQAAQPGRNGQGPASDKLRNAVGAFMSASRSNNENKKPTKGDVRERERKRTHKEEVWDLSENGKFAEVDSVLRKIKKDWPFVLESDFSPSTLALSLLSSVPSESLPAHPSLSSFTKLHGSLSTALQSAVQGHFQSFAASLPAHANFLTTLNRAQQQVRTSKTSLKEARDGFAGKGKSELAGVRARERMVRDMLKILDTIDELKQVPDQLESLIGDKRFLQAALILVRSLKSINKPEIAEIGAMSDLRNYFISQKSTLTDILVEELHSHIYLKTFYSDSRWKAHYHGQQDLPVIETYNEADAIQPVAENGNAIAGPGPSSRFSRYLSSLSVKPSSDPLLELLESDQRNSRNPQVGNISRSGSMGQAGSNPSLANLAGSNDVANPEANSFAYMEMLLESLAAMGKLGSALDVVAQRVSTELHALIDATLDEVEERSEQRREEEILQARPGNGGGSAQTTNNRQSVFAPSDGLKIALSLDATGPPIHAAILRDLFWTLYSKLAAVLEGHRVVYEVSRWISSRRDFKDTFSSKPTASLNIPVLEVWKPVQQEVRNLLHNYLTDDAQGSRLDAHPIISINEVLRDGRIARDKQKQMFKFADTDTKAISNEIKATDEALKLALKLSVPGLVNMQGADSSQNVLPGVSEDRLSTTGKHRTLIPPNAFNVSTLFQPTLSFIHRATSIVPPGFEDETGAFHSVLEDFVVKVFLPQLDEKVTASFRQAVSGYDAFQVDRELSLEMTKPPLKSSVRVMGLIYSLCVMLQTTPFHRENYSRLIVGVIVQYYQQCSARFRELATSHDLSSDSPLALPAVWAQREDLIKILTEMRTLSNMDRPGILAVEQKETKLEMGLPGKNRLVESQLVASSRKLEALGHLAQSLRWFIEQLLDLQSIAEEPTSPEAVDGRSEMLTLHPTIALEVGENPQLPLTRAMAQRYEAIVQTYEQLVEMVLNTIRLEIRSRVICNLGASLQKGDFRLESEALEPDPDVVDLNTTLTECDEIVSLTLSSDDQSFVFAGLGHLVDHIFIHSARSIKLVNTAGVKKIKRNITSLQQSLRSIVHTAEDGLLNKSLSYWDMYDRGPKEMLDSLKNENPIFGFEDYNVMLNLQCKADQSEAPSSELNTYLIDLHALSMSIEGWDGEE